MDKRIIDFLKEHHVLTLATCYNEQPWCASMFYVFLEEEAVLVFTSDEATRHLREGRGNAKVAGAIALETETIGLIRGVQFSGLLQEANTSPLKKKALRTYLKRFPYAILNTSPLWLLHIDELKFTDNRLGFGKKLRWKRDEDSL